MRHLNAERAMFERVAISFIGSCVPVILGFCDFLGCIDNVQFCLGKEKCLAVLTSSIEQILWKSEPEKLGSIHDDSILL